MPMGYNKDAEITDGGGKAEPGTYRFKVDQAEEKRFNSGNPGAKITLLVAAFPDRDIKVFINLVYVDAAAWKIDQFLTSIGLDYRRPPEIHELYGLMGEAVFTTGEKGYLEVDEFLPGSANNGPDSRPTPVPPPVVLPSGSGAFDEQNPPPITDDDDLPF